MVGNSVQGKLMSNPSRSFSTKIEQLVVIRLVLALVLLTILTTTILYCTKKVQASLTFPILYCTKKVQASLTFPSPISKCSNHHVEHYDSVYGQKVIRAREMATECTFQLNKQIYGCGEIVGGSITLTLSNPEPIEAITVVLRGYGYVSWNEYERKERQDGSRTITEVTEFKSHENYVEQLQQLMSIGHLEAGRHTFPFSLQLPEDCPGSFQGEMGSICYCLKAVLLTTARSRTKFEYDIVVEKQNDLNLHPEYQVPIQIEQIKTFGWITCKKRRILFTLTTPTGAYAPMQRLHYTLQVENQSMNDVQGYELVIRQNSVYTARTPYAKTNSDCTDIVTEEYDDTCPKLTTCLFEHDVEIPAVPPTVEGEDDTIIRISYTLHISVCISGSAMNSEIYMPLHIGTMALEESLQQETERDLVNARLCMPPLPSSSWGGSASPPSYTSLEPPSFDEAIKTVQRPSSFYSAVMASAPPYEKIVNERNRPLIGFNVPK